jgi:hypothetical protein
LRWQPELSETGTFCTRRGREYLHSPLRLLSCCLLLMLREGLWGCLEDLALQKQLGFEGMLLGSQSLLGALNWLQGHLPWPCWNCPGSPLRGHTLGHGSVSERRPEMLGVGCGKIFKSIWGQTPKDMTPFAACEGSPPLPGALVHTASGYKHTTHLPWGPCSFSECLYLWGMHSEY